MECKTLFQRLNSEVLIKIQNDQKEFPVIVNSILKELNSKKFLFDITLDTATSIYHYHSGLSFDLDEFYNLFE